MTTKEHLIDLDQQGNEIDVELDAINNRRILVVDFPLPSKPLNFIQLMTLRSKVKAEMMQFISTRKPPEDPFEAARVLANKIKEVLTKNYKSMGVL